LQQLPDFTDKKVLKELLAEAVDQKEVQSRNEGGKQLYHKDDLLFVGWIKQMRGNSNSPLGLGFYLNGERSGPRASWYGSRKLKDMGLFDEGRKNGLYLTQGRKEGWPLDHLRRIRQGAPAGHLQERRRGAGLIRECPT
jgi:hypothetical protein